MPLNLKPILYDGNQKTVTEIRAPWLQEADLAIGAFVHWTSLAEMGWRCLVLARAAPCPPVPHRKIELIDGTGNPFPHIQECLAWVVNRWRQNQKVAVLCRSGANRAPAIAAAAWYLAERSPSVRLALDWMRPQRSEIGHYGNTAMEVEAAARGMLSIKKEFLEEEV